ncbi:MULTISPECIES: hypothetical protein [unclassified Mesorhizobium]|uniref:hypothetical protein n=1 Tax=unclassified Mesorhizobium TaxID=325217 RepID=UPI00143F35F8|nr:MULTISPECIES: hypothetical protein [unclassified Mesorhizobium]
MQNLGKKVLLRGLKTMCGRNVKHLYLTRYSVEGISAEKRKAFTLKVQRRFETF